MRKVAFFIITGVLLICVPTFAESCFTSRVQKGDGYMNHAQYDEAIDYYESAKKCHDAPRDLTNLNKKIANAKSKKDEAENRMSVSLTSISFEASGNYSKSVQVTSRRSWSYNASQVPYWLTIEKRNNGLTISCVDNKITQSRSFGLVISNGKVKKTITVSQRPCERSSIKIFEHWYYLNSGSYNYFVKVETDADYYDAYTDVQGAEPWITVEKAMGGLNVKCYSNNKIYDRTAKIYVTTNDGVTDSCVVYQNANERPAVVADEEPWYAGRFKLGWRIFDAGIGLNSAFSIGSGLHMRIGRHSDYLNLLFGVDYIYHSSFDLKNMSKSWFWYNVGHQIVLPLDLRINLFRNINGCSFFIECSSEFGWRIIDKYSNEHMSKSTFALVPGIGFNFRRADLCFYYRYYLRDKGPLNDDFATVYETSEDANKFGCYLTVYF